MEDLEHHPRASFYIKQETTERKNRMAIATNFRIDLSIDRNDWTPLNPIIDSARFQKV